MSSNSPVVHDAVAYLERTIDGLPSGTRLPTTLTMARQAGVSVNAMSAAVKALSADGRLTARRRRGIVVGSPAREDRATPTDREQSDTGSRLCRDIHTGAYDGSPTLPSAKELSLRYGVGYRTMRRGLDRALSRGLVERAGRRFRLARPWSKVSASIACIVEPGFGADTPGFQYARWHAEFVRGLEQSCRDHRIRPLVLPFGSDPSAPLPSLDGIPSLLGVVLWHSDRPFPKLGRTLSTLKRYTSHVCLFDPDGDLQLPARTPGGLRLTLLRLNQRAPGLEAAQHLLSLGHRRLAFFSPYHGSPWSSTRLDTLREALALDGLPGALRAFTSDTTTGMRAGRLPSGDDPTTQVPVDVRRASAAMGKALQRHGVPLSDREAITRAAYRNAETAALGAILHPMFAQALTDRQITAWVCVNDKVARLALNYLEAKRIAVPAGLSVFGFDDSPEALDAGLTTYSFEFPRAGLRAVSLLAFPDLRKARFRTRVETVDGRLVARTSVGTVPGEYRGRG